MFGKYSQGARSGLFYPFSIYNSNVNCHGTHLYMTFRRQLAAQLCHRVCGFIRHCSKDLPPLFQREANHYETGDFCAENHKALCFEPVL